MNFPQSPEWVEPIAPPTGAEYTHVMSYNIYTANDNKTAVVDLILDQNPDIFGVQEASTAWNSAVAPLLEEYAMIGFGRDSTGANCENATATNNKGEGCYIFYRKSMFTVVEAKTYWLSDTPTAKSQFSVETDTYYRIVTYARLKRNSDGKELVFCNTHLELNASARALEVEAILNYMAPYVAQNIPVIITGDFNMSSTETAAFGQFAPAGFQSAGEAALVKGNTAPTFSTTDPKSIIDYIMCSDDMEISYYEVVTDASNTSDHRPIGAWVKY